MVEEKRPAHSPGQEHSVPWFWPFAAAIELQDEGLQLYRRNLNFLAEAGEIVAPPEPDWATPNHILLDLDTMRLREFGAREGLPVLIDAPYAGHSSTIVDYAGHRSLVETLLDSGVERVLASDWKSATPAMRDYDIDKYLAELNVAVDDAGGVVQLVGLCQGGWMSAMYAARFPDKVCALVLAGAPIDTDAGEGAIKKIAHSLPMSFYEELVELGGGRMLGRTMLAGWKSMHPGQQYVDKFLDLYEHIENKCYVERTEQFERWYENPIDLPGRYYLQAIELLFKENQLAKRQFVALGRPVDLRAIRVPLYLLAGAQDDITTKEQVFNAAALVGTPSEDIVEKLVPGGHIGLFMGARTLTGPWRDIGRWLVAQCR
jgi:poly(3-hydroxybutyrate) depolymerase